jgi:hypothetical protein
MADSGLTSLAHLLHVTQLASLTIRASEHPILVATLEGDTTRDELGRVISVLVIGQWTGQGYLQAFSRLYDGTEAEVVTQAFLDVADLDGDGTAELVVEQGYYESHTYLIYKRTNGAWVQAYLGGGGGC